MRFGTLLLSAVSLLSAAVAAAPSEKTQGVLGRVHKSKGYVVVNDDTFDSVVEAPRDYTAVVLMTALDPRFKCHLCKEFQPQFDAMGKSLLKAANKGLREKLVLAFADFQAAKNSFQKLGVTSAPMLFIYPPTTGPNAVSPKAQPLRFDFAREISAEAVAQFVEENTGVKLKIIHPYNYTKVFVTIGVVVGSIVSTIFAFPYVLPIIQSRQLWAAVTLISILLFTSAHMFNHIRKVPYLAQDAHGRVSYFAGGFSNQYGVETQIIAVCYALLAFCIINLGMKVPYMESAQKQTMSAWVWSGLVLIFFSFLISIFRIKNPQYPLYLPPFGKM